MNPSASSSKKSASLVTILIATWGVLGVLLLLLQAVWRLTPLALEPVLLGQLNLWQGLVYLAWVLFSCYAEGYRGFQKAFSPRVVARAFYVGRHPRWAHVLLAPAFCMALFHANRKRKLVAWIMVVAIVSVVILVRGFPQPYRGMIDGGVVIGLAWGMASIGVFFWRALQGQGLPVDPDLPREDP